jgi:hypothetical protein
MERNMKDRSGLLGADERAVDCRVHPGDLFSVVAVTDAFGAAVEGVCYARCADLHRAFRTLGRVLL